MTRRVVSTYRLQLTVGFGFRDAAQVVPYLSELGITHLYLSPPLEAQPGSTHGYDVVDHGALRAELGGEEGFDELVRAAAAHGMGIVLDFVPNHMGIGPRNMWWMDVLENGPSSVYGDWFDIDWRPVKDELEHKVLVPVLGDFFGEVLERGELVLSREGGTFWLDYFDNRFPVAPRAVPRILNWRLDELVAELGADDVNVMELQSVITSLSKLAPRRETDSEKVAERAREKEVAKRRLAGLFDASERVRAFVDENVARMNGTPGDARSFDRMEDLLDHQAYRLAHWRVAGEEINYRRFFDINSLAAIRMEDPRVFAAAHERVLALFAAGKIDGLRIDHPDGLYAPTAYFAALRHAAPGMFVVVEKILEGQEQMPSSWTVDGTTGYEMLNAVNGLFVDRRGERAFDLLCRRFVGVRGDFPELVYRTKKLIMSSSMASELNMLSHRLNRISETDRRTRDFTLNALSRALVEYVACLPVYRTYVEGRSPADVDARDRRYVDATVARARRRAPSLSATVFEFLRGILLLQRDGAGDLAVEFVRKLQQVTGSVTAKSVEDTAFYVHNRLVSLNEVGGDPERFGVEPAEVHRLLSERLARWPGSLNATSTHDTKRSEDVRLRIDALSEIPAEWMERIRRWSRMNRGHRTFLEGWAAPDRNEELLFYQNLVGAYPDEEDGAAREGFSARMVAYMSKALREAKVHMSWTNPDEAYDRAVAAFVVAVLKSETFLADFVPFQRRIAAAARVSSLAQTAIKVCAPGVADVYQGCDLWDLSLVDPDNRRPVDFVRRRAMIAALGQRLSDVRPDVRPDVRSDVRPDVRPDAARLRLAREVAASLVDGRAKLLLLRETLRLRRERPELFLSGEYLPLYVSGPDAGHVFAFARRHQGKHVVCVVPRLLLARPSGRWRGSVRLPEGAGRLQNVVSGATFAPIGGSDVPIDSLFENFPVFCGKD
jgi:(1->4)-alpha-D-glucan 1-alpha-D-glucosylmutase